MEVSFNQISDIALFGLVLVSVAVGWTFGYFKGIIIGYRHAEAEEIEAYPIMNVYFRDTAVDGEYEFIDMLTDEFIVKGTFEECMTHLKPQNAERKVVFSKMEGDIDEQ